MNSEENVLYYENKFCRRCLIKLKNLENKSDDALLTKEHELGLVFTRRFNAELRNLIGRKFNSHLMHF
jgi:hypothetical protein